jgi:hypothetical protein
MVDLSFHHDEPCSHQVLVSFAPSSAPQGHSRLLSGEVVPFAQFFAGGQQQTDIEIPRSSEGSRASFQFAETKRCARGRIAMLAMRPSS